MRIQSKVVIGAVIAVLLITSALAIYYRSEAVYFQREYTTAMELLGRVNVRQEESVRELAPVLHDDSDENLQRPVFESAPQDVAPVQAVVITDERPSETNQVRRRPSDWMENVRTNDPKRYEEFQQRRLAMQQNIQNAWVQSTNYFMNRDTSRMSRAEQEEYDTMVLLLVQASELNQQLQSGLPREVRQQVLASLRSNLVAVVPLLENERNREIFDAAVALGQSEQDAARMVTYVNQITSNTSLRSILPGVRIGGGRGGRPPGR